LPKTQTGEVGQNVWTLDEVKIAEDAEMDGCHCIITSECGWSAREVIDVYRDLSYIEESFRVLKSTMDTRPVFVWTEEHIRAHFLVCYVALMIMRLMQKNVEDASGMRPSADAISDALSNMVGHRLEKNVWYFDYRTDLTERLCDAVGVDLSRQVMTRS
jgi:hypothetical protein